MELKAIILGLVAIGIVAGCSVKKTEEGDLPQVKVETTGGELPEYKVEWVNVDVKKRTKTVKVPKVVVVMEEQEIDVPYLDFQMPGRENESYREETVSVELEVEGNVYDVDIEEAYTRGNKLIVISELEKTEQSLGNKRMRVSDRIIINSPENLSVKHYIIGEKPEGSYNARYDYVNSKEEISELEDAHLIYSKDN